MQPWPQVYAPLGHWLISAAVAVIPIVVLFYLLAVKRTSAPVAAFGGAVAAIVIAITVCGMPFSLAIMSFFRSEEHTSELQSQSNLVCRLLLEKKNTNKKIYATHL